VGDATTAVVGHGEAQAARAGLDGDRDPPGVRVAVHVGERLGDDEVRRHLDRLGPAGRFGVQRGGDRRTATQLPQGDDEPVLDERLRVDTGGELTQRTQRLGQMSLSRTDGGDQRGAVR
jgi:hypothetical protein